METSSSERSPCLIRWISPSWQNCGWGSGSLILNSMVFSPHPAARPGGDNPEGREDMKMEAEGLFPFISDSLLFGSLDMWEWAPNMYKLWKCKNIILGTPSSFPQFLECCVIYMGNSILQIKVDRGTHLVSVSFYITSPSPYHRSQEVFESENSHYHLCAFLTLKEKISSFCLILHMHVHLSNPVDLFPWNLDVLREIHSTNLQHQSLHSIWHFW